MSDDQIAKQLSRLVESIDGMRRDLAEMKATQAAAGQAVRDMDRRITQLENDTRWAFRLAVTGLFTWSATAFGMIVKFVLGQP